MHGTTTTIGVEQRGLLCLCSILCAIFACSVADVQFGNSARFLHCMDLMLCTLQRWVLIACNWLCTVRAMYIAVCICMCIMFNVYASVEAASLSNHDHTTRAPRLTVVYIID